jgi:hypothetical protein
MIFKVSKVQKSYENLNNLSQGCQCVLQQVFVAFWVVRFLTADKYFNSNE